MHYVQFISIIFVRQFCVLKIAVVTRAFSAAVIIKILIQHKILRNTAANTKASIAGIFVIVIVVILSVAVIEQIVVQLSEKDKPEVSRESN